MSVLIGGVLLPACGKSSSQDSSDTDEPPDTQETAEPDEEWRIDILSPTPGHVFDECAEICVRSQLLHWGEPAAGVTGQIEVENFGVFKEGSTDKDGYFRGCASGLELGTQNLAVSFFVDGQRINAFQEFETAPFGFSFGMEKENKP